MTLTECEIEKNGEELSNCYMDNSLRDTSGMFQADIYVNNNFVIQSKCNINRKENDKFYIYDLPSKDYYAKYSKKYNTFTYDSNSNSLQISGTGNKGKMIGKYVVELKNIRKE